MVCCAVATCNSTESTASQVRFFAFPIADEELLNIWLSICQRPDIDATNVEYARICSLHFKPSDYTMLSQQAKEVSAAIHEEHGHRMVLNNSAVPSQYLQSPAPIHAPPPPPPPSTNRKRSLKSGASAPTTSKRAVGTKQKKPRIPRVPTTSCSLVASRNVRHDLASTIDEIIASNEAIL